MKWLFSVIALLVLGGSLRAQTVRVKYQGWCEQGGFQVQTQGQNSTTRVQRTFQTCTITVFNHGTTDRAALFSDDQGTMLGNPFDNQNRTTGQYFFYADAGRYDIQFAATGLTTFTLTDVRLNNVTGGGGGNGMNCGLTQLDPSQIPLCAQMTGGIGYPQWWGAKADGVVLGGFGGGTGCYGNANSPVISCAAANFTAADVGKRFDFAHAGTLDCGPTTYGRNDLLLNCNLVGTIASVQGPQQLTLSTNVLHAVGNEQFVYASSDDAAIQAALDSGIPTIAFAGTYGITGPAVGTESLGNGAVGGVFHNRAVVGNGPGVSRLLRIGPIAWDGYAGATFIVENGSQYFTMSGLSIWGTNELGELTTFGPTHDGLLVCSGTPNAAVCNGLPGNANGNISNISFLNCDFSYNWGIGWHEPGTGPEGGPGVYTVLISHSVAMFDSYDGFNPNSTDGMIIDAVNGSYNGTGGLELTAQGNVTVTGSIFDHNKTGGMSFGGFTDNWEVNRTCNITGNDFSENGNGYIYNANNPPGSNTIGAGLQLGIGSRNCAVSGNTFRHNHQQGLGFYLTAKDRNIAVSNNIISTNGLIGVSQLSLGAYGTFYGVTMSNNQIVNEAYGDIISIGRTNNVVTVETAIANNYEVGYSVYLFGTPNGAFDTPTNPTTPVTITTFLDGRTFTFAQPGPDVQTVQFQPGFQSLGQVFSPTGGFSQNVGISVQDCNDTEIVNNTVRNHDYANVSFTQFYGDTYHNCLFTSQSNTMGQKSTVNSTGNRDLILFAVQANGGPYPLIPKPGGFVANVPSIQVNTTACTTAATPGATCTVYIDHYFGGDLGYIPSPADQLLMNRTTCTLDNTPTAQTGTPIILKVTEVSYYEAAVTIGTFDGQAAGGGPLTCKTNFRF